MRLGEPLGEAFPRAGGRWAHFEVASEVARGNMGVVFRARDTRSGREVALKVLLVGREDREACARFKREAKSLARLSHPNIVQVHSYGVHDGTPFLTMDFVPGTTLAGLLERGTLPVARSVDLLLRIARAVDHAHSRGVLHRDLKPANVLIGADGEPRITDFGLARLDDASQSQSGSLSQDGDLIGTPVFMSPEQIQGELLALGPSADVWALGVLLYLMLSGRLPFPGRTVDEVARLVVRTEPPPLGSLVPGLSSSCDDGPPGEPPVPDLERICRCALRKNPRERYQSAGELGRDLDRYLRGRRVLAGRVTAGVRARRALRALRQHALAAGLVAGALALGAGLVAGRALHAATRADRADDELELRAEARRGAAVAALDEGRAAWRRGDAAGLLERSRQARSEVEWAAAYRARAARDDGRLEEALRRPPGADEVSGALANEPALGRLLARAEGARARALVLDARLAQGEASPGALAALLRAVEVAGHEDDRAGLVELARRSGEAAHVRAALAALEGSARALAAIAAGAEPCAALARPDVPATTTGAGGGEPGAGEPGGGGERGDGEPAGVTDPAAAAAEASRALELVARATLLDPDPDAACPLCRARCALVAPPGAAAADCDVGAALAARQDVLGAAARQALARARLGRREPDLALRALEGGARAPGIEADLLRAAALRQLGRLDESAAALAPHLDERAGAGQPGVEGGADAARGPDAGGDRSTLDARPRGRAWAERARGLLAAGWPRAARRAAALGVRLAPRDDDARLVEAGCALALGASEEPLLALARQEDLSLPARLEAARLAGLVGVRADVPAVVAAGESRSAREARDALALARLAPVVAATAARRVALALGLPDPGAVDGRPDLSALAPLEAAARAAGDADALVALAVLLFDQGADDRARALLAVAPRCPAALAASRLVEPAAPGPAGATPPGPDGWPGGGQPGRALARPEPPGLAEGEALLAAAGGGPGGEAGDPQALPLREALRALGLAVNAAPLEAAPRRARARLLLRLASLASASTLPESAMPAAGALRAAALADAAVAAWAAPADAASRALLLQATWVADPSTSPRLGDRGPLLEPYEVLALRHVADVRRDERSWVRAGEPDDLAALRLATALARAQDGRPRPDARAGGVAAAWSERLATFGDARDDSLQAALVRAEVLLEDPRELDRWLALPPGGVDPDVLDIATSGEREPAARAFRIVARLRALGPRTTEQERRDTLSRARADLALLLRRRPCPAALALRAAIEVWAGEPGPGELEDLVAAPWPGALREHLVALRDGASLGSGGLAEALPLKRLAARLGR